MEQGPVRPGSARAAWSGECWSDEEELRWAELLLQPGGAELITWASIISTDGGKREIGKSGERPTSATITRGSFKAPTNGKVHLHAHKHSRIRRHPENFNFVA